MAQLIPCDDIIELKLKQSDIRFDIITKEVRKTLWKNKYSKSIHFESL